MNCSTPLFNDDHKSGLLIKIAPIIKKNKDKSVQEVYKLIIDMLNNLESFLFGEKNSSARYNASIASLREAILAVSEAPISKYMSQDSYVQLKRLFEENFLSDAGVASESVINNTDPETPYMENNPDMINEDERVKQKLSSIIETYYGTVIRANSYRRLQFGIDLVKAAIIDTDKKIIVRSNTDLNKALCYLKNRYLGNIVDYLLSIDPNFSAEPRIFGDNFKKLPGYELTLNKFYNELKVRKKEGLIEDLVTEGWKKRLSGESDLFYDALNSYVNLVYFDDILEDAIGKVILLSNSGYSGVELDAQFTKYKFSKGDEHKRKGFLNSENRNALNDIAKFSRLVLSTIPIYSSIDGKFLNRYVNVGNFANAITSLFTHAHLLRNNYLTLQEAITKFHSNPYYYSGIIFSELNKTPIQYALINAGVNRFNINILTSVFKYVFDTNNPNSIKSIETTSLKKLFSIDGYSIIDSINGVIDRTMDATYLLMVYSGDSEMVEVTPKKKFANRKISYNVINKINATNSSRPQEVRKKLSLRFPLSKTDLTAPSSEREYDSSCLTFSISLGANAITGINTSKMGVLDSKPISIKFSNPRMTLIFKPENTSIDLISKLSIDRIVSGQNLSEDEKMFRDVLEFIDSFLDTKFLSIDGLNKLYLYKVTNTNSENYLGEILESAIRAAVVNDLYLKFNDALTDGKYQSPLNFEDFLKEEYPPFSNIDFNDISETKTFFLNKLGIPDLISVRTSENWIDSLAEVESIMTGEVSKSTTNDINGNKIANNRTSFLGGNLQYYLSKYKVTGLRAATSPLLFTRNSNLVIKTVFNTDAESRLGIKKSVKDMKAAELFYSSIIYNFYGSYLQSKFNPDKFNEGKNELYKTVLTQPTTFSDKISFVMYAINANKALEAEGKSYNGMTVWELNTEQTLDLYLDTIGAAYINLFNNVLDDLRATLDMPLATFELINAKLNTTTPEELLSRALAKGIELLLDTHYRKFGNVCKFNELLYHYANELYVDRKALERRFRTEKIEFINDLLASGVSFYTNYSDDSDDVIKGKGGLHTSNPVSKIIRQLYKEGEERERFKNLWVKNNKLVLARVNGEPKINGAEIVVEPNDVVELNPLLEKYFYTDSLLSNNLRFELTGSEVAHPDKAKINYSEYVNLIRITPETNPDYFTYNDDGSVKLTKDSRGRIIPKVSDKFNDLLWVKSQPNLNSVYQLAILKIEAVAQGTLLKRNVIIPATLQYELLNTMNGIPSKLKVAVINDTLASIFNFRGDNTTEDAHDGSAYINPFVSILENKALLDQEVGVDKKPIWHSYNPRLMSATLLKFATFTMTNERMRTSLNSNISLYNLFKLMTNMQWSEDIRDELGNIIGKKWNNSRNALFNLVDTKGFRRNQFDKINFFSDILVNKPLFYEENGKHYLILDFGMDENGYYTIEAEVNPFGDRKDSEHDIKVYHVFDSLSNHLKFRDTIPTGEGLHTINSLFELFNAMGGIYSEELVEDEEGKRQLQYTDAASYAVVNFMNNISIRVGNNTEDLSQNTYYQPLKEMMIAYAANKSAVKNGIANLNSAEAWKGKTKLRYMVLDTDGLGILMDADHEIDEAEMTEFSQVISALEAGGRLHYMSKQVYRTLGELAIRASQIEIETAIKYIRAKNDGLSTDKIKSELYDILGRALINNYKLDENRTDLAAPIIAEIKKKFNLSEDHSLDSFKIPFSDSNLYTQTISTFVSSINSKSIKRKYPGSGCVMVPGYDIIQTYKYDGKVKLFDDVLKEARAVNFGKPFFRAFNPQTESIQDYNRSLVQAFLGQIQQEIWKEATTVPEYLVEAIDYLFAINPELSKIGTKKEYATYLQSLFPKSRIKDIYWHGTDSDMSNGLPIEKGRGSGAPETGSEMYFNKLPYASLQYISGVNRNISDVDGFNNWVKLWWELKEALGNGRMESDDWKNEIIGPDTRLYSPNKKGIFDRDSGGTHGKYLSERKARYGYENKSDKEFFEEVFGIKYGLETFNDWINRKREEFLTIWKNRQVTSGIIPALLNISNPISEEGQNTYYEEQRGLFTKASLQGNDAILSNKAKNEFGSDVAIVFDPKSNVHLLGTNLDLESFQIWKNSHSNVEEFMPTEFVDVLADGQYLTTIDLNDIGTYYKFKGFTEVDPDGINAEATRRGFIGQVSGVDISKVQNLTFAINVTRPRNLAPARIRWKYLDLNQVEHTANIFDTAPVRYSFLKRNDPTFNSRLNRKLIQKTFDELDSAFRNPNSATWDGYRVIPGSLENRAAELVISNMYASKFNTKGRSLAEILEKGPRAFRVGQVKPIYSSHYELAFTTNNGRHTYISFKTPKVDDNNAFKPKNIGWKYTRTITAGGQENVYATTKDGQILYKVGQNILMNGIDYIDGQFIDKETGEQVINPNLRINAKGLVVEYKEFLSNYKVIELLKNGKPIVYNLYVVSAKNIGEALLRVTENSVNGLIAKILSDVYEASSYNGIRMNYAMSGSSALRVSLVLPKLRAEGSLKELIDLTLSKYLVNIDPTTTFSINTTLYNKDLKDYYNKMANEIYTSFQKSLTFTASRIPALTLLSFMLMEAVALTLSSKNIAYVSHWQTWLLGSDYDIDKAYIMGYEFDDNGKYVGWSDLFDYSGIDKLRASEYLPIPDGVKYEKSDTGFDISEQITNIASRTTKADKLRAYADLLIKLQDQDITWIKGKKFAYVTWNDTIPNEVAEEVLSNLNLHSQTYLSPQKIEKCLKNSVSSSITNIILNLRNMDQAYSPIEMETVRDASKQSPKGNKSDRMTLLNPLTKFLMQEQNMVGKGVIGITAVGEKVFFNVSHYWNEGIRSRNETWIKNLQFSQTFDRILGRSKGINAITPVKKTTLANVNFESVEEMRLKFENLSAVDDQLRLKYMITDEDIQLLNEKWKLYKDELIQIARQKQDSDVYADDIISLLLSAATDFQQQKIDTNIFCHFK